MNCRIWEERIALHAEGDLPPDQAAEAARHLAECVDCREWVMRLQQDLAMLRATHTEPIDTAHLAAVRARVLGQIQGERRAVWRLGWIGAALAAAVLAAFLLRPLPVEPLPVVRSLPPVPQIQPIEPAAAPPIPPRPRRSRKLSPPQAREPLMVKLVTDDPNVVIYWIAN